MAAEAVAKLGIGRGGPEPGPAVVGIRILGIELDGPAVIIQGPIELSDPRSAPWPAGNSADVAQSIDKASFKSLMALLLSCWRFQASADWRTPGRSGRRARWPDCNRRTPEPGPP